MKLYAKIEDEITGICSVGVGTNAEYYESIGMTLEDVEQSSDGQWYLTGYAPKQTVEELKAQKLNELNAAHEQAEDDAHVVSSLGFTADADDRANRDIDGILKTIGDGTIMFCDYDNNFHELNRAQCETLQIEIIQNAQALYAQKWQYRTQVEAAESVEELGAIEFTFSQMRF